MTKVRTQEELDKRVELWFDMPEEEWGQPSLAEYLEWTEHEFTNWFQKGEFP